MNIMTTILFEEIEEKHIYEQNMKTAEEMIQESHIKEFFNCDGKMREIVRRNNENKYLCTKINQGLLGAIYDAYINHIGLQIRPDDVWLSICQSFSLYINKHSEIYRDIFVNHQNKKRIDIRIDQIPKSQQQWEEFFNEFGEVVNSEIKCDILDWLRPNFTTTTKDDKIIAEIALMDTMKSYFDYGAIICCGIPRITLCGTKNDWGKLCDKISMLKMFNINELTVS